MKTKNNTTNKWQRVTINLPEHDFLEIMKLIEDGKYLNHSDFIRNAIKYRLENQ